MKASTSALLALLLSASSAASIPVDALADGGAPHLASDSHVFHASNLAARDTTNSSINSTTTAGGCSLDQTAPPGNLSLCGNATLFNIWRSKARVIAPEGWMNDPMAMWQREDGVLHAGWQCHPQVSPTSGLLRLLAPRPHQLITISFLTAYPVGKHIDVCCNLERPRDFCGLEQDTRARLRGPSASVRTSSPARALTFVFPVPCSQAPSEVFDIRGVFDGTIIPNGFEGYPSILYTATTPNGPLGATVVEIEGVESQAIGAWN